MVDVGWAAIPLLDDHLAAIFASLCHRSAVIATPAPAPKPRGKSPGWTPSQPRSCRIRYPTVRKRFRQPKASAKKSA